MPYVNAQHEREAVELVRSYSITSGSTSCDAQMNRSGSRRRKISTASRSCRALTWAWRERNRDCFHVGCPDQGRQVVQFAALERRFNAAVEGHVLRDLSRQRRSPADAVDRTAGRTERPGHGVRHAAIPRMSRKPRVVINAVLRRSLRPPCWWPWWCHVRETRRCLLAEPDISSTCR